MAALRAGRSKTTSQRAKRDATVLRNVQPYDIAQLNRQIAALTLRSNSLSSSSPFLSDAPAAPDPAHAMPLGPNLQSINNDLLVHKLSFSPDVRDLIFCGDHMMGPSQKRNIEEIEGPNTGPLALQSEHPVNLHFLNYEQYLFITLFSVEELVDGPQLQSQNPDDIAQSLINNLYDEIQRLEHLKATEWDRRRRSQSGENHNGTVNTGDLDIYRLVSRKFTCFSA
ncbi:hypothetical protein PHLCEN_2v11850 [Hermanssonia centrifuga]|uniref:Uncharacterized protein n=1 Tax=Hermanssonia centrifuga TaxID=98765 RepID=A0A2R6NJ38_9APHY|nr:hypothetical protein PHLCEN_2v11850 [Hermanssonia centrifuga]